MTSPRQRLLFFLFYLLDLKYFDLKKVKKIRERYRMCSLEHRALDTTRSHLKLSSRHLLLYFQITKW